MGEPIFWRGIANATLADVVAWTGVHAQAGADFSLPVFWVAPLEDAEPGCVVFFDHPKYRDALAATRATACFVTPHHASLVPAGTVALVSESPSRALATMLAKLCPASLQPGSLFNSRGISPGAYIHPDARLEPEVIVDPGAVIGPRAEIGARTTIGPNVVIGPDVCLGRDCSIGAQVTIVHALIGNRVIIHPGVRIGQDGFGFVPGRPAHLKVPQIGRVIIQDDVEIGANTAIDRGSTRDTVIGEGSKIDNLVQIAHNVSIGRGCLIVAQAGIAGSAEIGDFVTVGGQAGIAGHLKIGAGAEIAGQSGVIADVPPRARIGGTPAVPLRRWLRAHVRLDRWIRGQ